MITYKLTKQSFNKNYDSIVISNLFLNGTVLEFASYTSLTQSIIISKHVE